MGSEMCIRDSMGAMALTAGASLGGIADLGSAFAGQPDISLDAVDSGSIEAMNIVAFVGAILMAAGAVAIVGLLLPALRSSEVLPDDPWDGFTLEWATPSPPPVGNFVEPIGRIRSAEPLLDEMEEVN